MPVIRRDQRKAFSADVDVLVGGQTHWAHARNVSLNGLCFECERQLEDGDAVHVDLSGFGLGLRIAIVRHARHEDESCVVGVEFFRPLGSTELERLVASA